MNFTSLEFFMEVCNSSFLNACELFKIGTNDSFYTIRDLQDYLGFDLFMESESPSLEKLTQHGRAFLPYAKKITDSISDGILNVCEQSQAKNVLIIRSQFSYGKSIILPCISQIVEDKKFSEIDINFLTYSNSSYKSDVLNTHVIFHESSKNNDIFFDKRWSVIIGQGLYASDGYLKDIGNFPKKTEDLLMHSIIGRGEFFDCASYKNTNWHLSGLYGLCSLEPSIMISSQTVLMAAVVANLGIGPIVHHHDKIGYKKLTRILPEIDGPDIVIDFDVRKRIPKHLVECIDELEMVILKKLHELELEIVYY